MHVFSPSGSMYEFPGSMYEFPGSIYEFPGSMYEFRGSMYEFPGSMYEFPGSMYEFLGLMYEFLGLMYEFPIGYPCSGKSPTSLPGIRSYAFTFDSMMMSGENNSFCFGLCLVLDLETTTINPMRSGKQASPTHSPMIRPTLSVVEYRTQKTKNEVDCPT